MWKVIQEVIQEVIQDVVCLLQIPLQDVSNEVQSNFPTLLTN